MEYNAPAEKGRYKKIYECLTPETRITGDFTPDVLVKELKDLTHTLGIPKNLTEVGVTEDKIPAMSEDAMKSGNIAVNPRETTIEDIKALYFAAMK